MKTGINESDSDISDFPIIMSGINCNERGVEVEVSRQIKRNTACLNIPRAFSGIIGNRYVFIVCTIK